MCIPLFITLVALTTNIVAFTVTLFPSNAPNEIDFLGEGVMNIKSGQRFKCFTDRPPSLGFLREVVHEEAGYHNLIQFDDILKCTAAYTGDECAVVNNLEHITLNMFEGEYSEVTGLCEYMVEDECTPKNGTHVSLNLGPPGSHTTPHQLIINVFVPFFCPPLFLPTIGHLTLQDSEVVVLPHLGELYSAIDRLSFQLEVSDHCRLVHQQTVQTTGSREPWQFRANDITRASLMQLLGDIHLVKFPQQPCTEENVSLRLLFDDKVEHTINITFTSPPVPPPSLPPPSPIPSSPPSEPPTSPAPSTSPPMPQPDRTLVVRRGETVSLGSDTTVDRLDCGEGGQLIVPHDITLRIEKNSPSGVGCTLTGSGTVLFPTLICDHGTVIRGEGGELTIGGNIEIAQNDTCQIGPSVHTLSGFIYNKGYAVVRGLAGVPSLSTIVCEPGSVLFIGGALTDVELFDVESDLQNKDNPTAKLQVNAVSSFTRVTCCGLVSIRSILSLETTYAAQRRCPTGFIVEKEGILLMSGTTISNVDIELSGGRLSVVQSSTLSGGSLSCVNDGVVDTKEDAELLLDTSAAAFGGRDGTTCTCKGAGEILIAKHSGQVDIHNATIYRVRNKGNTQITSMRVFRKGTFINDVTGTMLLVPGGEIIPVPGTATTTVTSAVLTNFGKIFLVPLFVSKVRTTQELANTFSITVEFLLKEGSEQTIGQGMILALKTRCLLDGKSRQQIGSILRIESPAEAGGCVIGENMVGSDNVDDTGKIEVMGNAELTVEGPVDVPYRLQGLEDSMVKLGTLGNVTLERNTVLIGYTEIGPYSLLTIVNIVLGEGDLVFAFGKDTYGSLHSTGAVTTAQTGALVRFTNNDLYAPNDGFPEFFDFFSARVVDGFLIPAALGNIRGLAETIVNFLQFEVDVELGPLIINSSSSNEPAMTQPTSPSGSTGNPGSPTVFPPSSRAIPTTPPTTDDDTERGRNPLEYIIPCSLALLFLLIVVIVLICYVRYNNKHNIPTWHDPYHHESPQRLTTTPVSTSLTQPSVNEDEDDTRNLLSEVREPRSSAELPPFDPRPDPSGTAMNTPAPTPVSTPVVSGILQAPLSIYHMGSSPQSSSGHSSPRERNMQTTQMSGSRGNSCRASPHQITASSAQGTAMASTPSPIHRSSGAMDNFANLPVFTGSLDVPHDVEAHGGSPTPTQGHQARTNTPIILPLSPISPPRALVP